MGVRHFVKNQRTFSGKVVLIVNVASQCGFTKANYAQLQPIYEKYKAKGFEVAAFPCNQFNGQESGSNAEIKEFACSLHKATYDLYDKIDVNGGNTHPLWAYLKKQKSGLLGMEWVLDTNFPSPSLQLHQVELHQVPRRPRRRAHQALRAE